MTTLTHQEFGSPSPRASAAAGTATATAEGVLRRALTAVALLGIALIHVLDLPGKMQETPYLGVAYLGLIAGCVLVAEGLIRAENRQLWLAAGGLALATLVGFVINRTVGMPGATDDIGNWSEPLGIASLFVEGVVVLLAGLGLIRVRS